MAANWHLGPMLAFDTETTGVDVENDRIVTVTTAMLRPGAQPEISSSLIAVDVDIPEGATKVHGITTEHARANGEKPTAVLPYVAADIALAMTHGIPVVAMKATFDLTILDRELRRNGIDTLPDRLDGRLGPVLDVYVIDKYLEPYRGGKRTLTDLCKVYGVRHDGAHDATEDALAAARIAWRIGQRTQLSVDDLVGLYRDRKRPTEVARNVERLGRLSLADLHTAQVGWCREQCDSLRAYFDDRDQKHDGVPGDWPMYPYRPAAGDAR
jgi:DNA polymerase-3 subunit epsilon